MKIIMWIEIQIHIAKTTQNKFKKENEGSKIESTEMVRTTTLQYNTIASRMKA